MVGILLAPQDPSSTYSKAASAGMDCAIQSSTGLSDSKTGQGQTEEEMEAPVCPVPQQGPLAPAAKQILGSA